MTKPIKFRGRATTFDIGKMVYGDIIHVNGEPTIYDDYTTRQYCVEPGSIAQLVGFDSDGNEVYEGDKVVSEYGFSVNARLVDNLPPKPKLRED